MLFNRDEALVDKALEVVTDSRDLARAGNAFVHARPVVATLMGVGAGLILSVFYNPRRSRRHEELRAAHSTPKPRKRKR